MPRRARIRDDDPLDPSSSEQVSELLESQPVEQSVSQKDINLISQEADQPTTQQTDTLASEPAINITSQLDGKQKSQSRKPPNQKEDFPAVELKKATFQLDTSVLTKLEKYVLTLQLELGKPNAPYKEVIVEEAIERLLTLNQAKLLKALERRQRRRKD